MDTAQEMSWPLAFFWDIKRVIHHPEVQNEPLSLLSLSCNSGKVFHQKQGSSNRRDGERSHSPRQPGFVSSLLQTPFLWLRLSHLEQGKLQGLSVAKGVMPGQGLNQLCVFFIPSCIHEEVPLWRSSEIDGFTPRKGVSHFWIKTLHLPNAWSLMCAWI